MKLAKWSLFVAMVATTNAHALTFCKNIKPEGQQGGGATWMILLRDKCPTTTKGVGNMTAFGYVLESSDGTGCIYKSPRTKSSGEKLICETKLTEKQLIDRVEASKLRNSSLQRYIARWKKSSRKSLANDDVPLEGSFESDSSVSSSTLQEPIQHPSEPEGSGILR